MNKGNDNKKQKRKLKIKELAQIAIEKINENKILNETLYIFQSQINIIIKILNKKLKLNIDNNDNKDGTSITLNSNISGKNNNENNTKLNIISIIKNDFLSYYQQLKELVESSREVNNKYMQKCEKNNSTIFDELSLLKLDLNKNRIDNFILDYEIQQKNDLIKKLNENIKNSKKHSLFREIKRDTETNRAEGTKILNSENYYLQRDLQNECKNYNKCINKFHKKEKKIKKMKETSKSLKEFIKYFEQGKKSNLDNKVDKVDKKNNLIFGKKNNFDIKKNDIFSLHFKKKSNNKKKSDKDYNNSIEINELGKKYQFGGDSLIINDEDENNIKDQTFLPQNNNIESLFFSEKNLGVKNKEKEKKKKVKQKLDFLTIDELFDLNNEEGEKEVIIQEELHSDDEVIFEKKIKNKNRINIDYLPQIKKQVPSLYFNQIEFNKKKVMNEADLYSFQRREYNKQNIDQNIKTMKKKIKIIKRRLKVNKQKLKALIDFDKKAEEQYELLKNIKVLSSMKDYNISFMKNEFYNYRTRKNNKNNVIDEDEEKSHNYKEDDDKCDFDDIDDYSDKMRSRNKKYGKNKNNFQKTDIEEENKDNTNLKKYSEFDDDNKAKSK